MGGTRQCSRFRTNGTRCENETSYLDGWCRAQDCPGYTRPDPQPAPDTSRTESSEVIPSGASRDLLVELSVDTASDVEVTRRAVDSFRRHHGGSEREARVQLRSMLEDFLLDSKRRITQTGFTVLSRDGYRIVLDPDRRAVTGYSTAHRERTWAQVAAGVPSRIRPRLPVDRPAPEAGPPLPIDRVADAVDAASVRVTLRALREYGRLADLDGDPAATEAALRAELRGLPQGSVLPAREGTAASIDTGQRVWLVTVDARTVISVQPGSPP